MTRIQAAIDQICRARKYTEELLNHTDAGVWFRQPQEGVTHIAWQVGHLAVGQYNLALRRVRGEEPGDALFMLPHYVQLFGKGSQPLADAAAYPAAGEIRGFFERVHARVVEELNGLPERVADQPSYPPEHLMFKTKLGALEFCVCHEFLHAGQIALLRRLLGYPALR